MTDQVRVTLAAIAGAHGVRGEVRLKLFAEGIDSVARHARVTVGDREMTLKRVSGGGAMPVARFEGVDDRNAAEALRGQLVTVARDALPPLGDGEYYHADILGLPCVDAEGAALGTVVAIENFGAGDVIEIEKPGGKRVMVPFRAGIADIEGDRIVVDPLFLT